MVGIYTFRDPSSLFAVFSVYTHTHNTCGQHGEEPFPRIRGLYTESWFIQYPLSSSLPPTPMTSGIIRGSNESTSQHGCIHCQGNVPDGPCSPVKTPQSGQACLSSNESHNGPVPPPLPPSPHSHTHSCPKCKLSSTKTISKTSMCIYLHSVCLCMYILCVCVCV